ncbi:MAG TPA: YIP1 family protein [Candidatus Binatia bacterium]|nr:YIP1 family protein [Candidatus Binatia bacterium]
MMPFHERLLRAVQLDPAVYEEVESDEEALGQAMAVVVAASLAAGIGTGGGGGLVPVIIATLAALVGWVLWAVLAWLIGTKLLPGPNTEADIGQLLRTTGFSAAPGLLRVVGMIEALRGIVFLAAGVWMLAAMVVAVRSALDYEGNGRAIAVCAVGFLAQAAVLLIVVLTLGPAPETPQPAPAP